MHPRTEVHLLDELSNVRVQRGGATDGRLDGVQVIALWVRVFGQHDHDGGNGGHGGDAVDVEVEEVLVDGELGHDEDFCAGAGGSDAVVCLALEYVSVQNVFS